MNWNPIAFMAAAAIVTVPAIAEPAKEEPVRRSEQVIVIHRADGANKPDDDKMVSIRECTRNDAIDVSAEEKDEGGKVRKSRIVICPADGVAREDVIKRLQESRARLADNKALSDEMRARVLAAIDKAIAGQQDQSAR
jgi:hypothetical protein